MSERPLEPSNSSENPEQWAQIAQWESDRADEALSQLAQLREDVKPLVTALEQVQQSRIFYDESMNIDSHLTREVTEALQTFTTKYP